MISEYEIVVRLLMASFIGGLVGIEREASNRPAGLRTHVLVTVGSALIMLVSKYGFLDVMELGLESDPARLAAQVVSGIGFLGAGTILVQGNVVRGLTTAASLWVCACIGLAIGGGYYVGGVTVAIIVIFSLVILRIIEKSAFKNKLRTLYIVAEERPGVVGEVGMVLSRNDILIKNIEIDTRMIDKEICLHLVLVLKIPYNFLSNDLLLKIHEIEGVKLVDWEKI